ncbi:MAG: flagellar assembly protein FliW [Chloroflexi bacterium]|nr:MAG: flagellar assembly protein FliW [Chloroflexota bacterium]
MAQSIAIEQKQRRESQMAEMEDLSSLLGDESQPIEFTSGLVGLEEWRRFIIISHPAGESLRLLQSLDDDRVSFIVANPEQIVPDYRVTLSDADAAAIKFTGGRGPISTDNSDLDLYCILSVQEEPFSVTANLLGPLVINWKTGLGLQAVLTDSNYNPRHPVAGQAAGQSTAPAKTTGKGA